MSRTISRDKVAVKLGDYFEIFDKNEVPKTLEKYNIKVEKNDIIYNVYQARSLADEKIIDSMFGDRIGYSIYKYKVNKPQCPLLRQDGNIYNLMGITSRTLKRNGMRALGDEMWNRITSEAKSYDEALSIIGEYVEITSKAKIEEDEF